jgi:hypothetical protein
MKKKDGKLIIDDKLATEQYRIFLMSLKEGDKLDVLFEVKAEDNTKAQLAKIHVCIKEMADETGNTVEDMKRQVKDECGMSYKNEKGKKVYESFAGCSKKELSNVIETIIQMGRFIGMTFGTLEDQ